MTNEKLLSFAMSRADVDGDLYERDADIIEYTLDNMPFTIPELCGLKPVDRSEAALVLNGESYTAEKISISDIAKMRVTSNYAISDVHFIIRDAESNIVFNAMYAALTEDIDRNTPVLLLKN